MVNGVTDLGFNRKRLDEIVTDINAEFRLVFGDNMNLEAESPDGQIVGIFSKALADLWEAAEAAYNSASPLTATGAALSRLTILGGIQRKVATATAVELQLTGTAGAIIPAGSQAGQVDGAVVTISEAVTLSAGGTATATATATTTGPIVIDAGTVTNIESPVTGWATVDNAAVGVLGTDEETDTQLRTRFIQTRSTAGAGTVDAIYAAVANVAGVTLVTVDENRSSATITASGLPGHHVRVVVQGGDDDEIATAIWQNKPAGIGTDGNTFNTVIDSQGQPQGISFSRPAAVAIRVDGLVATVSDASGDGTSTNVAAEIAAAIVEWAAANIGVGEDVIANKLFTPINAASGQYDVSINVALVSDPSNFLDVVPITSEEIATFDIANISLLVI